LVHLATKLGNLKIKSALVLLFPLFYLCYWSEKLCYRLLTLSSVNSFDVTKNLLIMIVFAFLMIATSVSMIRKSKKIKEAKEINF
jgi:hypothetical protein